MIETPTRERRLDAALAVAMDEVEELRRLVAPELPSAAPRIVLWAPAGLRPRDVAVLAPALALALAEHIPGVAVSVVHPGEIPLPLAVAAGEPPVARPVPEDAAAGALNEADAVVLLGAAPPLDDATPVLDAPPLGPAMLLPDAFPAEQLAARVALLRAAGRHPHGAHVLLVGPPPQDAGALERLRTLVERVAADADGPAGVVTVDVPPAQAATLQAQLGHPVHTADAALDAVQVLALAADATATVDEDGILGAAARAYGRRAATLRADDIEPVAGVGDRTALDAALAALAARARDRALAGYGALRPGFLRSAEELGAVVASLRAANRAVTDAAAHDRAAARARIDELEAAVETAMRRAGAAESETADLRRRAGGLEEALVAANAELRALQLELLDARARRALPRARRLAGRARRFAGRVRRRLRTMRHGR